MGIPLSIVITAANTHDVKAAIKTLDSIVIKRPIKNKKKKQQNLCLDKGYDSHEIEREVVKRRYIPHIRRRGEKKSKYNSGKKRRWVVERTNSWHNRFKKLLIRYEKKSENYLGLVQLACCMIIYRRILLG
jgi:putative transposase